MKNIGLQRFLYADIDNFTSNTGIKIRKLINKPFRKLLKLGTKRKIILEHYPKLEKGKSYIFAPNHSFDEDAIANLSVIDRNAYLLIGTTEQIEHNPTIYAAWLNGMIYVNRKDADSRKSSIEKMQKILNAGNSVLLFPEGGWNNTENLLVQKLFAGPYILSQKANVSVVPIASFNSHNSDKIYVRVGEPLELAGMNKEEALRILRDAIATMFWKELEEHAERITRDSLDKDCRLNFMEERRQEYLRVKWTRDVWDEELTVYHGFDGPADVRKSLKDVKITKYNAGIISDELNKYNDDLKYDFKKYMHENWNK